MTIHFLAGHKKNSSAKKSRIVVFHRLQNYILYNEFSLHPTTIYSTYCTHLEVGFQYFLLKLLSKQKSILN